MISIYTHSNNPFTKEFWKSSIKRLAGRYSGPDAVRDSLCRGLTQHTIPFTLNPHQPSETTMVLSGTSALRFAIQQKRNGKIHTLIAGPNILALPKEKGDVMLQEEIDSILVPSHWVAELWKREAPEIATKIRVWPAGIAPATASTRSGKPIIYDKVGNKKLLDEVRHAMGDEVRVFTYGSFSRDIYLDALTDAPYMVYLSHSESQGLALFEAWTRDVPTLVNISTTWSDKEKSFTAKNLNESLGRFFTDQAELATLIEQVPHISPKPYCDTHFSDSASTEMLLSIIHEKAH